MPIIFCLLAATTIKYQTTTALMTPSVTSTVFSMRINISSTPVPIIVSPPSIDWEIFVGLVQVLAALIAYFSTSLACKLFMQRISFCVPVYLATPILAILIYLQCSGYLPNLPLLGQYQYEMVCPMSYTTSWLLLVGSAAYWLSALWLTSYIWFPQAERLAFAEK